MPNSFGRFVSKMTWDRSKNLFYINWALYVGLNRSLNVCELKKHFLTYIHSTVHRLLCFRRLAPLASRRIKAFQFENQLPPYCLVSASIVASHRVATKATIQSTFMKTDTVERYALHVSRTRWSNSALNISCHFWQLMEFHVILIFLISQILFFEI